MPYIKKLQIEGFKRFDKFSIEFNDNLNIIVGENESGKSTILEAIEIVLNQINSKIDKYIVDEYLNLENKRKFRESPCIENLPRIKIDLFINLDDEPGIQTIDFSGKENIENEQGSGIQFICEFDDSVGEELKDKIEQGIIPYDYYNMTWHTFSGDPYKLLKKPLASLFIDNSSIDSNNSFNYYYKMLFSSKYSKDEKLKYKSSFREQLNTLFDELNLANLDDTSRFGINQKKMILENILTIYDEGIPLENRGKGQENLIKTKIAIDKAKNKLDTILIEEPENHLSHTSLRKMISSIESQEVKSQLILTTHNSLIVNKLGLKNVLWIADNKSKSLKSIDEDVANYFNRVDNNNILQFVLAEKVILVEGATEYLLVPRIFEMLYKESINKYGIDIISCNGISYKNYINIAESLSKKVLVLTDNDGGTVEKSTKDNVLIACETDPTLFTWEVCVYELNEKMLKDIISIEDTAEYCFKNVNYRENGKPVLGKMLNNKVDTALSILKEIDNEDSKYSFIVPQYVKDALTWIKG